MGKTIRRKTRETRVDVQLDLDGSGAYRVEVPHAFIRHMIESLARFARFDLEVRASGDDDHHIVEDVGLTLGRALRERLGERPIARIGTASVPMDEALVTVAVDLIDRPYAEVPLPDPLVEHFLRSLVHEARFTCHVVVLRGRDDHHVMEATFKALGLALHQATRPVATAMTTKGRARWKR